MGAKTAKKTRPQKPVAGDSKKAKPTEADLAAAARLRELWDNAKDRPTQEGLHDEWSQSTVSQYLSGAIPLNFYACCVFARGLKIQVEQIRTDLPEQQLGLVFHVPGANLDESRSKEWDAVWNTYPPEEKARILAMADMASKIKHRR